MFLVAKVLPLVSASAHPRVLLRIVEDRRPLCHQTHCSSIASKFSYHESERAREPSGLYCSCWTMWIDIDIDILDFDFDLGFCFLAWRPMAKLAMPMGRPLSFRTQDTRARMYSFSLCFLVPSHNGSGMILRATRTSDGADYSVPVRLSILGTYEPRCYELRWGYFQSNLERRRLGSTIVFSCVPFVCFQSSSSITRLPSSPFDLRNSSL